MTKMHNYQMMCRNYSFVLLACLAAWLTACNEAEPQPKTVKETTDQVVMPHIVFGSNVGIIVGISRNGEKTISSYGEAELGTRTSITAQSVFEIASLTKTFTALALADMHLKGEVDLDDPVEKFLPPGVKVPSRNGKPITLKQLANHTSGLPGLPSNLDDKDAFNPYKGYSLEKLYDFLNHHSLQNDPGSTYAYSNVGYALLGHALSLRNKSDYETLIVSRIARPLGMTHTITGIHEELFPDKVQGYYGNQKVDSWAKYMQEGIQGGGALISTMEDQLRYLDANMDVTSTPLQKAMTLAHQTTQQITGYYQEGIGLGWYTVTVNGRIITWKNGLNGGFTSFMGFDKTTKTGVVILCNSSMNPDLLQTKMGFALLERLRQFE